MTILTKEQSELNKNNVHFVCQIFTSIHALTSQKKFLVLIKDLNGVWNEATKFLVKHLNYVFDINKLLFRYWLMASLKITIFYSML